MKNNILGMILLTAPLAYAATASAEETTDSLSITTGLDYSKGDYGTGSDTEIIVVPVTARYKTGDIRLSASLPWLHIKGASSIVGGGDGGPIIIDPNAPRTSRGGIGDLTLGANWAPREEQLGFGFDLGARVKIPTASSTKGLGTGKVDVSVSAELSKTFGPVTPFVSAGYRFPGDPDGVDLRNAFFGSVGITVVAGKTVLIASYDYRKATSPLSEDGEEIFGALSTPVTDRMNFTFYGSGGLSDGAPDFGVGAMLTFKLR